MARDLYRHHPAGGQRPAHLIGVKGSPGSEVWLQEDNGNTKLIASARGLTSGCDLLRGFEERQLKRVTHVDISFNSIKSISGLDALCCMAYLDIRCNAISSVQAILPTLRRCSALKHLRMKACGKWAKDPKGYHHDMCKELPGLLSVDDIKNPYKLTDQQWRAQRFLNRVFGIGPNEIADINLNGMQICGEDFACVLRALSHLPVIRLHMQNNPASQIRGYRCYAVTMVKSLRELDGQPVTSDERVNAKREIDDMTKEVESVHLEMDRQKWIQKQLFTKTPSNTPYLKNTTSWYDASEENTDYQIEEISKNNQPEASLTSSCSPFTPRTLNFQGSNNPMLSSTAKAPKTPGRKIDLMLVASKPLREDIVEFLEDDDTGGNLMRNLDMPEVLRGLENAPTQAISGRLMSKLEILLNFLQIYRLIFRFSVPWPRIWHIMNSEADMTTWLLHSVPSLLFGGTGEMSANKGMIIFVCFLLLPVLFLGLYSARFLDYLVPERLDRMLVRFTGHSWKMLRKRAALFGITVSYLPLANTMLSILTPALDKNHAVVIAGLPSIPWPSEPSNPFTMSEHWPMIVAGVACALYILGIPLTCGYLITKGAKEAGTAHDVDEAKKQIADMKRKLADESFASYVPEISACIAERERAHGLLYAKAVREYHKAQTYLYEDYHEKAKFYKIVIMAWKILMLANVLGIGSAALTISRKFVTMQATSGLIIVFAMMLVAIIKRPYQASSENLLEMGLIGANLLNAIIGFLLSIVLEVGLNSDSSDITSVSGNVTGGILIIINALALFFAFGVIAATPCLNWLAKRDLKHLKDINIQNVVQHATQLDSSVIDIASPCSIGSERESHWEKSGSAGVTPSRSRQPFQPITNMEQGGIAAGDLHRTIREIAKVSCNVPKRPQGQQQRGIAGALQDVTGTRASASVKKNKSIILQLFDSEYSSPFYKRIQKLRLSSPASDDL